MDLITSKRLISIVEYRGLINHTPPFVGRGSSLVKNYVVFCRACIQTINYTPSSFLTLKTHSFTFIMDDQDHT